MAAQSIPNELSLVAAKAQLALERTQQAITVEQLVRDHAQTVYRVAYSLLRDHHDAEDAAQETFIRVMKQKTKLADVRDAKTWLVKIAWRVALDRATAARKVPVTSIDEDAAVAAMVRDGSIPADEVVASSQMASLMQRLIASLPQELREVVELSSVQELNSAEMAAVLDIPEGSVRSRLMRARAILKEKLQAVGAR